MSGLCCCLQVNTPLEPATQLSEEVENELLLKREDLQAVRLSELGNTLCQVGVSYRGSEASDTSETHHEKSLLWNQIVVYTAAISALSIAS